MCADTLAKFRAISCNFAQFRARRGVHNKAGQKETQCKWRHTCWRHEAFSKGRTNGKIRSQAIRTEGVFLKATQRKKRFAHVEAFSIRLGKGKHSVKGGTRGGDAKRFPKGWTNGKIRSRAICTEGVFVKTTQRKTTFRARRGWVEAKGRFEK